MTQQNFSVRAEITGGVSEEFRQSVVASSQNLTRFAENTTDLVRTQRTAERTIARTTRRIEFLNQELEDTQEGSKAAAQLTKQIGTANKSIRLAQFVLSDVNDELSEMRRRAGKAAEEVQDVGDELVDTGNRGERALERAQRGFRGLRTSIAAGVTALAGFAAIQDLTRDIERMQDVLRDAPQLSRTQARQLIRAADLIGFDEGSIADIANEFNNRLGEIELDPEALPDFQAAAATLNLDLDQISTLGPIQQMEALREALAAVQDVAQRTSLADQLAGGQGGQALNFLASDARAAQIVFDELNSTPIITDATFQRNEQFRTDLKRMEQGVEDVRASLVAGAQPAISGFSDLVVDATEAVAKWAQENGALASTIGGVVAVTPTFVSAVSEFTENVAFATIAADGLGRAGARVGRTAGKIGDFARSARRGACCKSAEYRRGSSRKDSRTLGKRH